MSVFLLLTHPTKAETLLTIEASEFADREFYLLLTTDHLSGSQEIIAAQTANPEGQLTFRVEVKTIRRYRIQSSSWYAEVYLSPNTSSRIRLAKPKNPEAKRFSNNELEVIFFDLPENDPNRLMNAYYRDYDRFFGRQALELAVKLGKGDKGVLVEDSTIQAEFTYQKGADSLIQAWTERLDSLDEPFSKSLLRAALGRLDLELGLQGALVVQKWLDQGDEVFENPEQYALFEGLHELVLANDSVPKEALLKAVFAAEAAEAMRLLKAYPLTRTNCERRQVLRLIVRQLWYEERMERSKLLAFLNALDSDSEPVCFALAGRMQEQLSKGSKWAEHFLPDFTLVNHRGERVNLRDLEGQLLYLSVIHTKSATCLREMTVLETLHKKFGKQVQFLTLVMDDEADNLRNYLAAHPDQMWDFFQGSGHPLLSQALRLKTVPSFYLLKPSGQLIQDHTPAPSEGLHDALLRLTRSEADRIKVWD